MQIFQVPTRALRGRLKQTRVGILLLLAGGMGLSFAAEVPDASKPGGAQPGREFKTPLPPPERLPLHKYKAQKSKDMQNALTRIRVTKIELQGAIDRPELGISVTELLRFIETLRKQKLAPTPASPEQEIRQDKDSNLLKEIEKMAGEANGEAEQKVLNELIRRIDTPPGIADTLTLQELQEIAASVAQYYRSRGLFLAQAFIPPQTVAEGVIQIRVLEGILGNVSIEKNTHYHDDLLLMPFRSLLGLPITKMQIEEAMLLMNDYPGLKTFAVFKPGTNMGEADLLISVLEEDLFDARLHADNYGSEFTGEYRAKLDMNINSPSGGIDKLTASLSKTYNPANGSYVALLYQRSAFGPKNRFGFEVNENTYRLGSDFSSLGIDGRTAQSRIFWHRAFHRSRFFNSYGLFQFSRKSAILNIEQGTGRADELSVGYVEMGFDWSSPTRKNIVTGWASYSRGFDALFGALEPTNDPTQTTSSRRGGSGMYAGGKYEKYNIDYQHWLKLTSDHMLHLSFQGQYSDDLLTSIEQMSIGGPNSVRAYGASEYLRDRGYSISLEWIMRAPGFGNWNAFGNKRWREVVQVALFADYAEGWLNDPLASDIEFIKLYGIGGGLRFNYKTISARLEIASPLSKEKASNNRDPQYYFEMNYGF